MTLISTLDSKNPLVNIGRHNIANPLIGEDTRHQIISDINRGTLLNGLKYEVDDENLTSKIVDSLQITDQEAALLIEAHSQEPSYVAKLVIDLRGSLAHQLARIGVKCQWSITKDNISRDGTGTISRTFTYSDLKLLDNNENPLGTLKCNYITQFTFDREKVQWVFPESVSFESSDELTGQLISESIRNEKVNITPLLENLNLKELPIPHYLEKSLINLTRGNFEDRARVALLPEITNHTVQLFKLKDQEVLDADDLDYLLQPNIDFQNLAIQLENVNNDIKKIKKLPNGLSNHLLNHLEFISQLTPEDYNPEIIEFLVEDVRQILSAINNDNEKKQIILLYKSFIENYPQLKHPIHTYFLETNIKFTKDMIVAKPRFQTQSRPLPERKYFDDFADRNPMFRKHIERTKLVKDSNGDLVVPFDNTKLVYETTKRRFAPLLNAIHHIYSKVDSDKENLLSHKDDLKQMAFDLHREALKFYKTPNHTANDMLRFKENLLEIVNDTQSGIKTNNSGCWAIFKRVLACIKNFFTCSEPRKISSSSIFKNTRKQVNAMELSTDINFSKLGKFNSGD